MAKPSYVQKGSRQNKSLTTTWWLENQFIWGTEHRNLPATEKWSKLGRTRKLLARRQLLWKADFTVQKFSLNLFSKLSKYFSNYLFIRLLSGHSLTVSLQSFIQCENYLLLKPSPHFHLNLQSPVYLPFQFPKDLNLEKDFSAGLWQMSLNRKKNNSLLVHNQVWFVYLSPRRTSVDSDPNLFYKDICFRW